MYTLTTLDLLRQYLGLESGADDALLLAALEAASMQIERRTGRRFCPFVATLPHTLNPRNPSDLLLTGDLLELAALHCNDGRTVDISDALLLPGDGRPAGVIRLVGGAAFTWDIMPEHAVSVTGLWGWHDDWANAWRESGDAVQDAALDESDTAITVTDAAGTDAVGDSPRFQVGHLLRIEDEYLRVTAITLDDESDTLTVLRGVNGTTAAPHAEDTPIDTYCLPADIDRLCLRWAAALYKEPDNRAPGGISAALLREADALRRL